MLPFSIQTPTNYKPSFLVLKPQQHSLEDIVTSLVLTVQVYSTDYLVIDLQTLDFIEETTFFSPLIQEEKRKTKNSMPTH